MRSFFWGMIVIIGCTRAAHAWNAEGHMVVAQIAYNHLTPSVKTACDNLIAVTLPQNNTGENAFVPAAVWPDTFKTTLGSGNAHYFDLPFSTDASSTASAWAATKAESLDVVRAIRQCTAILQSSSASQKEKGTALRYLIHYVGDIQQPLHGTTHVIGGDTGDAGGNGFSLTGTFSNLHSLWDAGGGFVNNGISPPIAGGDQTTINNDVTAAETVEPYVDNSGTIVDPMVWVQEDLTYAKTVSYVGVTAGGTPSGGYLTTAQNLAKQRLAQGGHRLADLLNTIMVSSSDVPTLDVSEPQLTSISGNSATTPGALAIDASGNLIVWDGSTTAQLLHMAPDGMDDGNSFSIATQTTLLAAINASNGTATSATAITPLTLQMAADGDIIMLATTTPGTVETLLSITNSATPTITVIAVAVNAGANPIDGAVDFCLSGNNAYLAMDDTAGASEDKLVRIDTNDAAAPSPTVTVISTEAQLNSAFGTSSHALRPGPVALSPGGTVWVCDSAVTGRTDTWVSVNTSTGVATLGVNKSDTLSDLVTAGYTGAAEVGYTGAVFSPAGNLYCLNQFGTSGNASDDSVIELGSPGGGTATTYIRDLQQVQIDTGGDGTWSTGNTLGGSAGLNAIAISPLNGRIYYSVSTSVGSKGIASIGVASLPVELSSFVAE